MHNVVFSTNIQGNRFLIVGVELWRGGGAIAEDAISFRAYTASGVKFVFVAGTHNLIDLSLLGFDATLVDLSAAVIPTPPILGEFWFMAWADASSRRPDAVTVRLYAFDGSSFRTVWNPKNFFSPDSDTAVQVGPNGEVTINSLPKWDSETLIQERCTVTAKGLEKVSESTTQRE